MMLCVSTSIIIIITIIDIGQSILVNQWAKGVGATNGEETWASTSAFIPQPSASYGSITLGKQMSAEFDFIWHGRASNANPNEFENFFRVGFDAEISPGCDGSGSRYPSFWLTPAQQGNYMHVSVSNGNICQPAPQLGYEEIEAGVSYHVRISFNESWLAVGVGLTHTYPSGFPQYSNAWARDGTQPQYIGTEATVWFMSNAHASITPYVCGNATFSNITLTSYSFAPTASPTYVPAAELPLSTAAPSDSPIVVTYPTLVVPSVTTKTPAPSPLNEAAVTDAPTAQSISTTSNTDGGNQRRSDASAELLLGMDLTAVIGVSVAVVGVLCVCVVVIIAICICKRPQKIHDYSANDPISTADKTKPSRNVALSDDATTYTAVIMDADDHENESHYIDADGQARRISASTGENGVDDSSDCDDEDDKHFSPVPYGDYLSSAQKQAFRKMKSETPGGPEGKANHVNHHAMQ